jgi:phosphoribosylformylglycinamidine (FGAM) synthase-like enzyme
MDEKEKRDLLLMMENQFNAGYKVTKADIIKAKIDFEVAESQIRSAVASEQNARYMLWSTIAAAISAIASVAAVLIGVLGHR